MMGKDKGERGPHIIVKPGLGRLPIVPMRERLHGPPDLKKKNALQSTHYGLNGSSEEVAAPHKVLSHQSRSPGGSVTRLMTMPSHSAHSALQRLPISMDTDMDNNLSICNCNDTETASTLQEVLSFGQRHTLKCEYTAILCHFITAKWV